jgi:hypothetical protein
LTFWKACTFTSSLPSPVAKYSAGLSLQMAGLEKRKEAADLLSKDAGALERGDYGGGGGGGGGGLFINASGHKQEVERIFSMWSIVGFAMTTGNTWLALGGSLVCIYVRLVPIGPLPHKPLAVLKYFSLIFCSPN